MPTPHTRLTTGQATALIATMRATIEQRQNDRAAAGHRYHQVRRGVFADRDAAGLPRGLWDQYDYWIDEYDGPQGRGWTATVDRPTTEAENDDGVARSWRFTVHVGPETYRDGPGVWVPVEEAI